MSGGVQITKAEWRKAWRIAYKRAWDLTHSKSRCRELVSLAFADVGDPPGEPWTPNGRQTLAQYVCSRVWSRFGNQITSYEWQNVRDEVDEDTMEHPLYRWNPETLLLAKEEVERATRLRGSLDVRVKGDPLIALLLQENVEPPPDPNPRGVGGRPEGTEAESTRRALKAGYTLEEIKAARLRLKRHAIAVMKEERERFG
jgi:hypothetical protein